MAGPAGATGVRAALPAEPRRTPHRSAWRPEPPRAQFPGAAPPAPQAGAIGAAGLEVGVERREQDLLGGLLAARAEHLEAPVALAVEAERERDAPGWRCRSEASEPGAASAPAGRTVRGNRSAARRAEPGRARQEPAQIGADVREAAGRDRVALADQQIAGELGALAHASACSRRPAAEAVQHRLVEDPLALALLELGGDVVPEQPDLPGRAALGLELADRAAVDHRGREVDPLLDEDRRHRAVLGQRHDRVRGDLGAQVGGVDHEHHAAMRALDHVDRAGDRAQIVRARPGRDDHQAGDVDHPLDRHVDRGRRVDHDQAAAFEPQPLEVGGQLRERGRGERRRRALAGVPPGRQRALGIGVDQSDRALARELRLDGEMPGERGLARAALLRAERDDVHRRVSPRAGARGRRHRWRTQAPVEHSDRLSILPVKMR